MQKRNLFIVPLFLLYFALHAQDRVGCNQLLEDAREAYSAGMVELVPELLLPCLETGLTGEAKQDAYKLVINAYLFDYQPDMANSLMSDFLDEFPDYQAVSSDPAEFVLLLRSHQQERAAREEQAREEQAREEQAREEQARQQEQARQEDQEAERERQVTPERETQREEPVRDTRLPGRREALRPALGIAAGINGTFPTVIEPFSTGMPLEDEGGFSMGGPGFQAGITADFPLGRVPWVTVGIYYNRTRFDYSASPFEFTGYIAEEHHHRIQLPVSMLFYLNPESRTRVFLRAGITADYLLGASLSATRTYSGTGDAVLRDVVLEEQDVTGSRSSMGLWGQAGTGVKIAVSSGSFFLETRFQSGFSMVNREEARYSLEDLTWLIYHIDSDFRMHQLSFLVGFSWDL